MSNKALSYVFANSKTKGSARVLMLAIADMANDDGECYPGRANLADKVNVGERQLSNLIRDCELIGELRVYQRSHSAEDHRTNKYYIVGLYDEKRATKTRTAKVPKPRSFPKPEESKEGHEKRVSHGGRRKRVAGGHEKRVADAPPLGHEKLVSTNPLLSTLTIEPKDSLDASLSSGPHLNETATNTPPERDDEVIPAPAAPVEVKVVPQRKPGSFGALHPELSDEELDALAARLEAEEAAKKQKLLELNTANALAEEELYVAVREVFGAGGGEIGEAGNYVRMLRGKMKIGRKKKKLAPDTWDEMSTLFKDEPVDAEELREWAAAWKLVNKDASMVKDPVRVASSIDARRQSGKIIGSTKNATDGFRPIDTTVQQIDRRLLL